MVGDISLPADDADDLPECCWRCVYLLHKEFSVSYVDGQVFLFCAYSWPDKLTDITPPCLTSM